MAKVKLTRLPDFPGYAVSRDGRVWSCKDFWGGFTFPWKPLKPKRDPYGYLLVGLWKARKQYWKKIHLLVYVTFNGSVPEGLEVNHEDCDKTNNGTDNLVAVTHAENMKHAWRNGRMQVHYGNSHRTGKSIYGGVS